MKVCSVEFCDNIAVRKGLCWRHYHQMRKHGGIIQRTIYDPNRFILEGDICKIILYNKEKKFAGEAIIDKEDYGLVKNIKWSLMSNGYVVGSIKAVKENRRPLLHRYILQVGIKDLEIDHKDRNPLNNRKTNLRLCTHSQNMQNAKMQKGNLANFKGVVWEPRTNKWIATLTLSGKRISLGCYRLKQDAAIAYNNGAEKYFGEFARVNTI